MRIYGADKLKMISPPHFEPSGGNYFYNKKAPEKKSSGVESPFNIFFCDIHYETEKHKLHKLMGTGFMRSARSVVSSLHQSARGTFVFLVGL